MPACLTRNRTALQMPCGSVKSSAQNIMGDTAIGTTVLMVAVPGMVLGLILMMLKVKETKGVDMGAIRGDEFEGK